MAGIKRLSAQPRLEADDDGVTVRLTSGDETDAYSLSWHHFTLALHAAQKLYAEGEASRRGRVAQFKAGRGH